LADYLAADKNPARRARKTAEEQTKRSHARGLARTAAGRGGKGFRPRRCAPIKPEADKRDGQVDGLTKDRWVKLREGISEATYDRIEALNVRGLTAERVYRRVYPGNELAAHLLGFVNKEGAAAAGVESKFDLT
jgi:cell division protein FtsI (penicillin-binding protein 3)